MTTALRLPINMQEEDGHSNLLVHLPQISALQTGHVKDLMAWKKRNYQSSKIGQQLVNDGDLSNQSLRQWAWAAWLGWQPGYIN